MNINKLNLQALNNKQVKKYILFFIFSLILTPFFAIAKENQSNLEYKILPGDTLWALS